MNEDDYDDNEDTDGCGGGGGELIKLTIWFQWIEMVSVKDKDEDGNLIIMFFCGVFVFIVGRN